MEPMQPMSKDVKQVYDLFRKEGLEGQSLVNELLRYKVLDQIISANANVQQYGLSLEELYALAKNTTEESFGPMQIPLERYGKLYQASFLVDMFTFFEETHLVEGIRSGKELEPVLDRALLSLSSEAKKYEGMRIVIGSIDEIGSLIDPILQALGGYDLTFYSPVEHVVDLMKRLYPLANFVHSLEDVECDAFLYVHRNSFDSVWNTWPSVYNFITSQKVSLMHMFLPLTAIYEDAYSKELHEGKSNHFMDELLSLEGLDQITEWIPYGLYQCELHREKTTHMDVAFKEVHGDTLRTKVIGSVKKEEARKWRHFTLVSHLLCEEGFHNFENKNFTNYSEALLPHEVWPNRKTDMMDMVDTALWVLYLKSKEGKEISAFLHEITASERGYNQLLCGVNRPSVSREEEEAISGEYWKHLHAYEFALQEIEDKWTKDQRDLMKKFISYL